MTAALAIFVGCGNNSNHSYSHDAHAEESHNHAPGIIEFTKAQADAAELEIETVQPASFNAVIRTSGDILPAQDN